MIPSWQICQQKHKNIVQIYSHLCKRCHKEIGVNIEGHPSRVLMFVISDVSMGDTVGLKVDMQLGEYVLRKSHEEAIFGVTYEDTKLIAPDFKDEDDIDD